MNFRTIADDFIQEADGGRPRAEDLLSFGVKFLDDAMLGIFPDDLVLVGAPTGSGKTQLSVNIAKANVEKGKRVHFIALEASKYEIAQRLKYERIADIFFTDPNRPMIFDFNYQSWLTGKYDGQLDNYEKEAVLFGAENYSRLGIFTKEDVFNAERLIELVSEIEGSSDLVIIDHVHYFDWDDKDDNRAIKDIAKTVRWLALECRLPIVLIAHLRKRDKNSHDLAGGADEFHGSSDLTKIATKVLSIGPGQVNDGSRYETFFRISKNRLDGSVTRVIGRCAFNLKRGQYEEDYQVGKQSKGQFESFFENDCPKWAKGHKSFGLFTVDSEDSRREGPFKKQGRPKGL